MEDSDVAVNIINATRGFVLRESEPRTTEEEGIAGERSSTRAASPCLPRTTRSGASRVEKQPVTKFDDDFDGGIQFYQPMK